jgi:hypothetical protein
MKSSVGEVSAAQLGLAAQAIARLVARIMRCVLFSFAPLIRDIYGDVTLLMRPSNEF